MPDDPFYVAQVEIKRGEQLMANKSEPLDSDSKPRLPGEGVQEGKLDNISVAAN